MDLYYNYRKVGSLPVDPTLTVRGLKMILNDWLRPQGITKYRVKFEFNNGTEVTPIVFEVDYYDHHNFVPYANLLPGGRIYITTW